MARTVHQDFEIRTTVLLDLVKRAIVDCGYKLDTVQAESGLITFRSGMSWKSWAGQELSALISECGNGVSRVDISGRRNSNGAILQIYDWGEAASIAKKVLRRISRLSNNLEPDPSPSSDPTHNLRRFRIIGVDRESHMDTSLVVTAATPENARIKGELQGIIVSDVSAI